MNAKGEICISGVAGFLGGHLSRLLLTSGYGVLGVDNYSTGFPEQIDRLREHTRFRFIEADVCDWSPGPEPVTAVLHLASPASPVDIRRLPLETMRAGAEGTRRLLAFAESHAAKFLLCSTSEVYGNPDRLPTKESHPGRTDPAGPRAPYIEAKRYAEAWTETRRRAGADCRIIRIFNTYGPGMRLDDGRAIPSFLVQALRGESLTIEGKGEQTRAFCYVDDLCRGLLASMEGPAHGPVNLGHPEERSVRGLAEDILKRCGSKSSLQHVERALDDPDRRCPDLQEARRRWNWEPQISLEEGLERMIKDFRERLGGAC